MERIPTGRIDPSSSLSMEHLAWDSIISVCRRGRRILKVIRSLRRNQGKRGAQNNTLCRTIVRALLMTHLIRPRRTSTPGIIQAPSASWLSYGIFDSPPSSLLQFFRPLRFLQLLHADRLRQKLVSLLYTSIHTYLQFSQPTRLYELEQFRHPVEFSTLLQLVHDVQSTQLEQLTHDLHRTQLLQFSLPSELVSTSV